MLPNETKAVRTISKLLKSELDCASRLLTFGVMFPSQGDLHRPSLRDDTVVTATSLYVKAITSFRASIHLCRIGCDRNALPINRSLFETACNLAFLIRQRISLYRFNESSKSNPKTPIELHGKSLTTAFRTDLYNAWSVLMSDKNVRRYCNTIGIKQGGRRLQKQLEEMESPYVDTLGADWLKAIKSSNTCTGLSIKDFASSLGQDYHLWYGLVYSGDSQHVHQSDMTDYIEYNVANGTFSPRWFTDHLRVKTTLHKACTLMLLCIEEMEKRFKFGDTSRSSIRGFSSELEAWKLTGQESSDQTS